MAELFSEVYSCYFQVLQSLVRKKSRITEKELRYHIQESCFEESLLYLFPRLTEQGWGFYEKQGGFLHARLSPDFFVPLTKLQRSYLKSILLDDKIRLFLSDEEIGEINDALSGAEPLFTPEDFTYYDRFADKDDYEDPGYREHFQTLMKAVADCEYLDILYESRYCRRVRHCCLPCRLEYSIKNDRFRLLAMEEGRRRGQRVVILNLSRIREILPTGRTERRPPDLNRALRRSYYREPVRILIKDRRNALERAMLQFANYEKSTRKIDGDTYECLIYYNKKTETELLIEILSFGPMIKVVGNETFLRLLKERLLRQKALDAGQTAGLCPERR